jgi:hypothetical protein
MGYLSVYYYALGTLIADKLSEQIYLVEYTPGPGEGEPFTGISGGSG